MHLKESDRVFTNVSLSDLENVGCELLKSLENHRIWLFYGEMGSGKTTFIKALCKQAGVIDVVTSPTFSIVNEYQTDAGEKIYHFDFYRLKKEEEAYDIGTEEYFDSGNYCFVEWPEKIPSFIPARHITITIQSQHSELRTLAISIHDGEEENRI